MAAKNVAANAHFMLSATANCTSLDVRAEWSICGVSFAVIDRITESITSTKNVRASTADLVHVTS